MSTKISSRNGSGGAITFVDFPTGAIETSTVHPDGESACGFVTKTDGTVKVLLTRMELPVDIPVLAGAYNHYSIDELQAGGSVDFTDIMLFWQ